MLYINSRANIAFVHDIIMASVSFVIALSLRLGVDIKFYPTNQIILGTILFALIAAPVFRAMKMYRGIWRYASLNDLLNITKSSSLIVLIFLIALFLTNRLEDIPRSLPFINWFVLIILLGGPRFIYRLFKDRRLELKLERNLNQRVPVLLVGANDNAELFIRDLARSDANYRAIGIVSITPARVGRNIHGVEILGTIDEIPNVVKGLSRGGIKPQRLVITSEKLEEVKISSLLNISNNLGMTLARLPALTDFTDDAKPKNDILVRPIDLEDLLGRPQTSLDRTAMNELVKNKRVLITGAGGSIGSELVRQISDFSPLCIALIDNSEINLYNIDMELSNRHPNLDRRILLADVRDHKRINQIFSTFQPDLVFHAAALKHVPLVEANALEGLSTNVLGTITVANSAKTFGVSTFVQISTDKAVNPTSIMGVSKRIAECYCQALDLDSNKTLQKPQNRGTRFVTVRFGNVLGSTGSVVELFKRQISAGGPVTVTDPDMKRYFMTVREAVELVISASVLGAASLDKAGRIYVLNMGEPILIKNLAKQMIRLAGRKPDEDIQIKYIGLRPGEKLFEEVFHSRETLDKTSHSGILLASPRAVDLAAIRIDTNELEEAIKNNDKDSAMKIIKNLVPEYSPP